MTSIDDEPMRRASFRVAPWYSIATAPIRFSTTPLWGEIYRRALGVRLLKDLPVETWRRSDTAFILGSGPSINQLTEHQWAEIRRHTSIGFNWWLRHSHVPDLYVFENLSEPHRSLLSERAVDYSGTPLVLKQFLSNFSPSKHRRRMRLLKMLPRDVRENIYMSSDFVVPGRNPKELAQMFHWIDRIGLISRANRLQWIPKRTASLFYLAAMSARAGAKQIVLCGVDLNRPGYFFDAPETKPDANGRAGGAVSSRLHATENPHFKVLPISSVLQVFNEQVLEPKGIELHVAHAKSALSRVLPTYAWAKTGLTR